MREVASEHRQRQMLSVAMQKLRRHWNAASVMSPVTMHPWRMIRIESGTRLARHFAERQCRETAMHIDDLPMGDPGAEDG